MIHTKYLRFCLILLPLLAGSCARFSIWEKSALIVGTGGAASTIILNSNYASAGASMAGGVGTAALGGTASMIIDAVEATPAQINAAEAAGQRYLAALDAATIKRREEKGQHFIAVSVPRTAKSRGQGEVMIYNTQKHKVETTKVYSLRRLPEPGEFVTLQLNQVEYVGLVPMMKPRPAGSIPTVVSEPLAGKVTP
jgi:hypothetical protein